MKLAEALQERADLNIKIENLRTRLGDNALVQEGEKTAEDPEELLEELDSSLSRLEELITRINQTNANAKVNGKSLTELIAHRDVLKLQIAAYQNVTGTASQNTRRATRSEIRILSAVNVKQLQKKTDALAKELRLTDNAIQAANWTIDLE